MRITKRQLRRIIKEEKRKVLAERKVRRIVRRRLMEQAGATAEFDNEYVTFPGGTNMEQEELAIEVASRAKWDDNFDKIKMYAAIALKQNHGVTTVTDFEFPGKSWAIDDFIAEIEEDGHPYAYKDPVDPYAKEKELENAGNEEGAQKYSGPALDLWNSGIRAALDNHGASYKDALARQDIPGALELSDGEKKGSFTGGYEWAKRHSQGLK